jgi:hypothetical protein
VVYPKRSAAKSKWLEFGEPRGVILHNEEGVCTLIVESNKNISKRKCKAILEVSGKCVGFV